MLPQAELKVTYNHYIETISRRGYRLIAPITNEAVLTELEPVLDPKAAKHKIDDGRVETFVFDNQIIDSTLSTDLVTLPRSTEAAANDAFRFLSLAIETGYPMNEIMNDPKLNNLRQDISYHKMIALK